MRVLIAGGTGFVGQALCPRLLAAGHEPVVLTRQSRARLPDARVRALTRLEDLAPGTIDGVVNLAGASIGDGRWTDARKRELLLSRVDTTRRLVRWMADANPRPTVLVSASAVGWYGDQGDREIDETTPPRPGFTHEICAAWEREAQAAEALGVRVCIARIGVVLDRDGGALAKMLPLFRVGGGGTMGSGRQWFPWIHREDLAAILQWLLETPAASGVYNASAPHPVTNAELTRALGRALGRPTLLPMPTAALQLVFGEMSQILTMSDRMVPKRLLASGFRFRWPELPPALAEILGRR